MILTHIRLSQQLHTVLPCVVALYNLVGVNGGRIWVMSFT